MCGIAGRLNFHGEPVVREQIQAMARRLAHRGPDDEGVFVDGAVGLGHRRLSIIDLSPQGHQPMSDETGEIWLTFNGEIYNFESLRKELERDGVRFRSHTDSEVIIYLYKKHGVGCLQFLRGMFAFAIWDARSRRLFLARDRLGKKPLKYSIDSHRFIFASEIKAILENPDVPSRIDWGAVDEYLTYQYIPAPRTGFQGIQKLEPAHYLLVHESGEITKERYWRIDFSKKESCSQEEWTQMLEQELREAVHLRLMSDVPLGAHLSGGIDSSLMVALMAQESRRRVKTFSVGFGEASGDELPYARLVAQRYDTDHHEFIVEPKAIELLPKIAEQFDEPLADSSILPTWMLCEMTRQHVTVAINGDGGDENFAGYARYKAMQRYRQLRRFDALVGSTHREWSGILQHVSHLMHSPRIGFFAHAFATYETSASKAYVNQFGFFSEEEKSQLFADELKIRTRDSRGSIIIDSLFDASRDLDPTEQLMYADIHSYLPDDLLTKTDMASMAHALELRSPLLDHVFMERAAGMPATLKLRDRRSKYLLKEIAQTHLPPELLFRPKQGFAPPIESWLRTSLHAFACEMLLDSAGLRYGFNKVFIKQRLDQHQRGQQNHARALWALLMLRLWLKKWFEG